MSWPLRVLLTPVMLLSMAVLIAIFVGSCLLAAFEWIVKGEEA